MSSSSLNIVLNIHIVPLFITSVSKFYWARGGMEVSKVRALFALSKGKLMYVMYIVRRMMTVKLFRVILMEKIKIF